MAAEDYVDFNDGYWDEREDGEPVRPFKTYKSLVSARRNGALWSLVEDGQVRSMHRNLYSTVQIAKELGRTVLSIQYRLKHLGLEENASNLAIVSLPGALAVPSNKPKKKGLPMTTSLQHLIALVQKGYTTIKVSLLYETNQPNKDYTYKVPTNNLPAVGDLVVVPTREIFMVAQVTEVHAEPQIDIDKPLALRWIVQKIDRTAYDDQTAREATAVKSVEVAQRRQAQEEALATLLGTAEDREAFLQLISPK